MLTLSRVLLLVSALAGCRAGYRTSAGAATAPAGFAGGNSRSIYIQDEGGILTRTALMGVGMVAAAGTVENVHSETDIVDHGDGTATATTTTTGTVNQQNAQAVQGYLDSVSDSKTSFITALGGPTVGLDIASQSLGGDTSGAQVELGWTFHKVKRFGDSRAGVGFRLFIGYGYGKYTFHDRMLETGDRGPPKFGEGHYKFSGLPLRLGLFGAKIPDGISSLVGTETYLKANINSADHNTFAIGQRLQLSLIFIEAELSKGSADHMDGDSTSIGLEVGAGF